MCLYNWAPNTVIGGQGGGSFTYFQEHIQHISKIKPSFLLTSEFVVKGHLCTGQLMRNLIGSSQQQNPGNRGA